MVQGADLDSEEYKARFYKKNQYSLYWARSSPRAESLHGECTVTPAISLHSQPLGRVNRPAMTYQNLYAISKVVTALVAMESARHMIDRIVVRRLVSKDMGRMGVNDDAQRATAVPGNAKIQHKKTTSWQTSIHPRLRSTEEMAGGLAVVGMGKGPKPSKRQ